MYNNGNVHQPYDAITPIKNIFEQIRTAKDIAMTTVSPYNEAQILNAAYNLVFNTNTFLETCREWRHLPQAQNNWNQFKIFFTGAY